MFRTVVLVLLSVLFASAAYAVAPPPVSLYPVPKQARFLSQPPVTVKRAAIVIGAKAPEPELYAAETLQKSVSKRYQQKWPIVRDNSNLKSYDTLIVLGQASTNKSIASACRGLDINPSENYPVQDGYALGVGKSGGKTIAVVAGSNPRSVIFGQDTLFQLIRRQGSGVALYPVTILDWPTMPHRGRVCTSSVQFREIEVMDALAQARLNFMDVREGKYGTPHDAPLNPETIKWVVKEAHRRGIIVYGTVYLGVDPPDYDKVMAKFQEFIDLGVDGLWPYLGDPGGEERAGTPLELIKRVLDLGKKHGMTGDLIHYTPGKMGYITIATNDNFAAAKIPGMDQALWFFAEKPTAKSHADANSLGLKKKQMWWYHGPHPSYGFSCASNVNFRADGKPRIYGDPTPLQEAYQSPTTQEFLKLPDYASGGIPWGGTVWLQETVVNPFGWMLWAPDAYDWRATRRRIYDYLYGPDLVGTAFELNDMLAELRDKFNAVIPVVLKNEADRPACRALIEKMYAPLKKLELNAAKGTMLDSARLELYFFEPMRKELETGKAMVELPHPELWWQANSNRISMAIREGNPTQALRWQAEAEKRVQGEVATARKMIDGVVKIGDYGGQWPAVFAKRSGEADYTTAPIVLDGELSEAAWSDAKALGKFETRGGEGKVEDESEVKVIYTDDAVYVGMLFHESNMGKVVASQTEHDSAVWTEDSFEIFINTNGLGRPYHQFLANSLGTTFETTYTATGESDAAWNGAWDVKVAKQAGGWTAEVRIPYTTLGVSKPLNDDMWLCNIARHDWALAGDANPPRTAQQITAWGYAGGDGSLHDPGKFRPLWFK